MKHVLTFSLSNFLFTLKIKDLLNSKLSFSTTFASSVEFSNSIIIHSSWLMYLPQFYFSNLCFKDLSLLVKVLFSENFLRCFRNLRKASFVPWNDDSAQKDGTFLSFDQNCSSNVLIEAGWNIKTMKLKSVISLNIYAGQLYSVLPLIVCTSLHYFMSINFTDIFYLMADQEFPRVGANPQRGEAPIYYSPKSSRKTA